MKLLSILALASAAAAHTLFTTLYVDGKNQGDGTCVRMPKDGATGTAPIYPITGDAMACGYGGRDPVPFVCPAASGAKLTFEFRLWPDAQRPGALDTGHKGPCAVYLKRVDDMFADPAAGDGWFKIWDDGYDNSTSEWCSDRLIAHDGLLSVDLPAGLAGGYYLVRPEILALHFAYKGDPQFYLGCAQVFIQGGPSDAPAVPKDKMVSIPGYVNADTLGLGFDIYKDTLPAYPMPGPAVYVPKSPSSSSSGGALKLAAAAQKLSKGAVPATCLIKNANWCAKEVAPYSDQDGCWAGVKDCYDQSKGCWDSARASGSANCYTWSDYCTAMNDACEREEFKGPPAFKGKEMFATSPGNIPEPWGASGGGSEDKGTSAREKGDDVVKTTMVKEVRTKTMSETPVAGTSSSKTTEESGSKSTETATVGGGGTAVLEVSTHACRVVGHSTTIKDQDGFPHAVYAKTPRNGPASLFLISLHPFPRRNSLVAAGPAAQVRNPPPSSPPFTLSAHNVRPFTISTGALPTRTVRFHSVQQLEQRTRSRYRYQPASPTTCHRDKKPAPRINAALSATAA